MSSQQFWLLIAVHAHPGLSAREIAALQRMDEPTASRVLAALARMDLVRATVDPDDRRRSRLALTAKGRRLATKLAPFAAQVRAAADAALTPPERVELRRLLHKVLDGVAALEAQSAIRQTSTEAWR
ncbi:MAG: winged helix-turn-helix transcriptional regulator [Myxococcaceae bacterium]|nr:winged helix-turn-helix transcriptional regulator [Myxococcaceae bacterium]